MAIVMNPAEFVLGQNAALWLDKATSDETKVKGLQGVGLGLGFTQQSTTVPAMGQRIAPRVYTGAEYDEMSINANFIPGDKSQEKLQKAALESTLLKNVRIYLKEGCAFSAPDQISTASGTTGNWTGGGYTSGTSGLTVGSFSDPQIGSPSDIFTNSVTMAPAGPFALFVAHTVPGGGLNVTIDSEATNSGSAEISLVDGTLWSSLGFEDGDTIIVDYDGGTPKYAEISSGAGTATIVLVVGKGDSAALTDGLLDSASGAVHGASSMMATSQDVSC